MLLDGEHMPHENGNGLMTDEKIGFEDTCDFILPQKKKGGKKAIFPFEVNQNINYKESLKNNVKRKLSTTFPPSTVSSLPLIIPNEGEERIPEEIRYLKDGFTAIQGFIENLG